MLFLNGGIVRECATATSGGAAVRSSHAGRGAGGAAGSRTLVPPDFTAASEGDFPLDNLERGDEAFTTSSIREVMPVVEVDGRRVGDGRPVPVAERLQGEIRLIP